MNILENIHQFFLFKHSWVMREAAGQTCPLFCQGVCSQRGFLSASAICVQRGCRWITHWRDDGFHHLISSKTHRNTHTTRPRLTTSFTLTLLCLLSCWPLKTCTRLVSRFWLWRVWPLTCEVLPQSSQWAHWVKVLCVNVTSKSDAHLHLKSKKFVPKVPCTRTESIFKMGTAFSTMLCKWGMIWWAFLILSPSIKDQRPGETSASTCQLLLLTADTEAKLHCKCLCFGSHPRMLGPATTIYSLSKPPALSVYLAVLKQFWGCKKNVLDHTRRTVRRK